MAEKTGLAAGLLGARLFAEQADSAALKVREARQNPQQSGLARSVAAEQGTAGALLNGQSAIAQSGVIAIEFPDLVQFNGLGHLP
jgi:hypothetical protein